MKENAFSLLFLVTLAASAQAASFYTASPAAVIPDNDLNGYQSSQTVAGVADPIASVVVTLDITGGFNGDLYACLLHNQATAVLLNRVGRSATSNVGYGNTGFGPDAASNSFTFDDQAVGDVHFYRNYSYVLNGSGQLTGPWQPDGRLLDPLTAGSAFAGAARSNMLGVFDGMDANGTWTLFVADVSGGGISTLVNWGIGITPVPEPAAGSLLGCALAAAFLARRARRQT